MSERAAASDRITFVAVVVPARDEELLLPACLDALEAARARLAADRPDVRTAVVVVLDDCHDGSAAVAAGRADVVLLTDAGNVGAARALGVAHAAGLAGADWGATAWLAHTDGDSRVPADWLVEHVATAEAGADVLVGTVRPDPADLDAARLAAWRLTRTAVANGHVHGANLGMRASTDALVGGIAPLGLHEDVDVVERARGAGARIVATQRCDVLTSGRLVGRTDGGYAGYLREDLVAG
ncbi:glycosyl transferase [Serinibacter arcticus]|uniref:4,4'-diaponeurosporenoate glycosyltransferase n=1 Tax=Serinibacter arcticus TaxID=1655435 RepID=A0A2U1ZXA6_9MICO|nr:glycosyltransferase [Serinibacter arcticus]PWD51552.1 glycosyl transferase [Serinibacter arcticus]